MKRGNDQQVFEQLRGLEVEIDRSRIAEMVNTIAKLPPPNNGLFHSLTLKKIIMGSLSCMAVATAIALLNIAEPQPASPQGKRSEPITQVVSSPFLHTGPEGPTLPPAGTTSRLSKGAEEHRAEPFDLLPPAAGVTQLASSANPTQEQFEPISIVQTSTVPAGEMPPNPLPSILRQFTLEGETYIVHQSPFNLSKGKAQRLMDMLWKYLREDQLVELQGAYAVIRLAADGIRVNGTPLLTEIATPYRRLFNRYGLSAAPNRFVLLYGGYIIAGDFDEEDKFRRGIAFGSGHPLTPEEAPVRKPNETITHQDCDSKTELKGNPKVLKRQLARKVQGDRLASSDANRLLVHFDGDKVALNYRRIPENLQNGYLSLLKKYGIFPCRTRFVEITSDYIAIGVQEKDGFHGRMDGRVDLSKLNTSLDLSRTIEK